QEARYPICGCAQASGIPCALFIEGGEFRIARARLASREGGRVCHCERKLEDRHCLRQTQSVCARERERRSNPESRCVKNSGSLRFARDDGRGWRVSGTVESQPRDPTNT